MPTPPQKGERKSEYVARCVKYLIENENLKPNQASAICYSNWENRKNKGDDNMSDDFETTGRAGHDSLVAGFYNELDPAELPQELRAERNQTTTEAERNFPTEDAPTVPEWDLPDDVRTAPHMKPAEGIDDLFPVD